MQSEKIRINEQGIKTYDDWEGPLHSYLRPNDRVDEEMVNHFLNVVPPIVCRQSFVQVGTPYSAVQGKNVFDTFAKENGDWVYKGLCHPFEQVNLVEFTQ